MSTTSQGQTPLSSSSSSAGTSSASSPVPPKKKGMSTGGKVALGLGIGCLVVILVGAIVGYFIYKQASKKVKEELNNFSPAKLEESLSNLANSAEIEKIAEELEDSTNPTSGKLKEPLSDGNVEITVNSFQRSAKIKDSTPAEDYEYIIMNVKLKSKATEVATVFTSNFVLRDNQANEYYIAYIEEGVLEKPISAWQYLSPNQEVSGDVVFEVKKGIKGLQVVYSGQKELQFDLSE